MAYVSSTIREDAFVQIQKLQMKEGNLDEYIAQHLTLIAELEWEEDEDMSCHSFRAGFVTHGQCVAYITSSVK